jgi:DNA polymerase-3 subunit epsilon
MYNKIQQNSIIWFKKLLEIDYFILDTETTGLTNFDEIIELGIIDNKGKIIFHNKFKPERNISFGAYNTHGISEYQLKDCKDFRLYYDEIKRIINGKNIVGYSAYFDCDMIKNTCNNRKLKELEYKKVYDVMRNYSNFNQEWNSYHNNWKWQKLVVACSQMGITVKDQHTAIGDCLLTLELIKKIQNLDIDG